MHIRCKSCHAAVWVEFPKEKNRAVTACCKTCGQEYHMQAGRRPTHVGRELARDARRVAEERGIDLAGAYSVLLGTMTVDDVERVRAAPAPVAAAPHAIEGTKEAGQDERGYDPAFESAVRDGLLTAREATQRGQRSSYAGILASRYRISLEAAYEVADNRISLLGAIRKNPKSDAVPLEFAIKRKGAPALYGAIVGTALLAVLAVLFRPAVPVPTARPGATRAVGRAEVRTDAEGRVVSVAALDPRSVLEAYCSADARHRLEPLGLATPARPIPGLRLGMLRRSRGSDEVLAIEIREDRKADRWLAGDGVIPLVAAKAPAGSASGIRPLNPSGPATPAATPPRASLTSTESRSSAPEATR